MGGAWCSRPVHVRRHSCLVKMRMHVRVCACRFLRPAWWLMQEAVAQGRTAAAAAAPPQRRPCYARWLAGTSSSCSLSAGRQGPRKGTARWGGARAECGCACACVAGSGGRQGPLQRGMTRWSQRPRPCSQHRLGRRTGPAYPNPLTFHLSLPNTPARVHACCPIPPAPPFPPKFPIPLPHAQAQQVSLPMDPSLRNPLPRPSSGEELVGGGVQAVRGAAAVCGDDVRR